MVETTLRDGGVTSDPRLTRIEQFDERSRDYRAVDSIKHDEPRSYTWRCSEYLNQGKEGACVGFGITHELMARPTTCAGDVALARYIYNEAKKIDPWEGEDYEGTSVLAGVKVAQNLGYFDSYYWCFSVEELAMAIGYRGPAVLGVAWFQGMYTPSAEGFIYPIGKQIGGHCILCNGVNIKYEFFSLHNSWGEGWGVGGDCYMSFEDMETLLKAGGEAVMFTGRKKIK